MRFYVALLTLLGIIYMANGQGYRNPLDCNPSTGLCRCLTFNGAPVTDYTRGLRRCDCFLRSASGGNGRPGAFVPRCAQDGSYQPVQCHPSTGFCWCVNPSGQQISDYQRGTPRC